MASKRSADAEVRKKLSRLKQIHVTRKFIRIPFASLPDLIDKAQTVGGHLAAVSTARADGTTLLGRAGANRIMSSCAGSTDFNATVQFCGLTGAGMQRCVVGKLKDGGYDPDPLNLNIQDGDTLDSIAATIQWAAK